MAEQFLDDPLLRFIRPPWVILKKLEDPKARELLNYRYFGDTGKTFKDIGIDLNKCLHHYGYIGGTSVVPGNTTPASERLSIKPIFAVKMSRRGRYYIDAQEIKEGYWAKDKSFAVVSITDWEELFEDNYFDKEIAPYIKRLDPNDPNSQVVLDTLLKYSELNDAS